MPSAPRITFMCVLYIGCATLVGNGVAAQGRPAPAFEPTLEMVSHLSCKEVWIGVSENKKAFFEVVELFAHHILTQRDIKFPNDAAVGKAFGDAVVKNCLDDSEELLYSAVNRSLRDTLPVVAVKK